MNAEQLIESLELAPHPEGGWYREVWRGPEADSGRAVGTSIIFLLETGQASHWHKVDAHELWLWQAGDPVCLSLAENDATAPTTLTLGSDIASGHALQGIVPSGHWQAARPAACDHSIGYSLVSCVVAPGFDFAGFELAPPGWQPGPHN